jgi:hypothetical protein
VNNVIKLFARKNAEIVLAEPETLVAAAVTKFLAMNEQLNRKVKELSKHFDSIENAIETIEDTETRTRLRESIKRSRESFLEATLKLSRQIRTVLGCRGA